MSSKQEVTNEVEEIAHSQYLGEGSLSWCNVTIVDITNSYPGNE